MRSSEKLGLLASLYLSQGLPYGFLTQAVPVLLRQEGATLTQVGDASLLLMPWFLKFLWAPFVDRHYSERIGRRRSWILPLQALSVLLLAGLALADPGRAIPVLLAATFFTALIASTQDVATDGLAVSLLSESERGLGNGVQVAGYRLGMVVGGGALLVVFARSGWTTSFAVMAALMALATLPVALWREPPPADPEGDGVPPARIGDFLRRPGMGLWLLLVLGYKLGEQLGGVVTKPMLVDLGLSLDTIGWLAAADSGSSLLGALLGGWLAGRYDRMRVLVVLGLLQATGVVAWALPALVSADPALVAGVKVYDGFVGSMATVALFTAMMDHCDPDQGGTDYTVQASVVLVASFAGVALGGRLGDALIGLLGSPAMGYAAHYAVAGALTVAGAVAIGVWGGPGRPDSWRNPRALSA